MAKKNPKKLTPPIPGEDMEHQEPSFTAGGNADGAAPLEDSFLWSKTVLRGLQS